MRAIASSLAVHLLVVFLLAVTLNIFLINHPKADYVIDLDMYESETSSSGTPKDLFPEPLSKAETSSLLEQAASVTTAPAPAKAASDITLTSGEPNEKAVAASSVSGDSVANASTGSNEKAGAGLGGDSDSGGSKDNGTGASNGNGLGSVASNEAEPPSRPTAPFDFNGFASAVEANKEYPYQAIKRELTGSVTMQITLDSSGSLISCEVIASSGSLLDKAAVRAVKAACPYPNPTNSTVTFSTTLHFVLN